MVFQLDEGSAAKLSPLELPCMEAGARDAFRLVVEHTQASNKGMADILSLALARGYVAHPCDWFPTPDYSRQPLPLYQPWVDEAAELGISCGKGPTFHSQVTPTSENWHRHAAPVASFSNFLAKDRPAAHRLLSSLNTLKWESWRSDVIGELGDHQTDTPILERLAAEGSEKIREKALLVLEGMAGERTDEQVAEKAAGLFEIRENRVVPISSVDPNSTMPIFTKTRLDHFSKKLGMSSLELINAWDMEYFHVQFASMVAKTGDVEARSRMAVRMIEADRPVGSQLYHLYRDVSEELWERACKQSFESVYPHNVLELHGFGVLTVEQVQAWEQFRRLEATIANPPGRNYGDPLHLLGLGADKEAAKMIYDEAIGFGLSQFDPRLSTLTFNLSL